MGRDLKHLFIVGARGVLEGPVAAVTEGPRPGHGEAVGGGLAEGIGDFGPLRRVRSQVHEPVGVEPVGVVRDAVEHEVDPPRPHESVSSGNNEEPLEG